jgi:predicted DNA-binding transcriptional regulator YafY
MASQRMGTTVDRAFQTALLFIKGGQVTTYTLKDHLGVCRQTAHRYLQAAVLNMPIYAVNEDSRAFHEPLKYQLIKEE